MQNNWETASSSYEQSLAVSVEHNDFEEEAHARNALGYFFFEKGNFNKASTEWESALEIAEKIKETRLVASFCTNLGSLANVQGNWEQALAYYNESIPRLEQIGQRRSLAETYQIGSRPWPTITRVFRDLNRSVSVGALQKHIITWQ